LPCIFSKLIYPVDFSFVSHDFKACFLFFTATFEIDHDANEDSTLFGSVCASVAMPFVKFSKPRWLVRERVIAIILSHWEPLKQYFATVLHHCPVAARKKAKMIHSVLSDDANHLFLSF